MNSGLSENNCFWIKQWSVLLDVGICFRAVASNNSLLLTHAHTDHSAGLMYYLALRSLFRLPACTIFVPEPNVADFSTIIKTWERLEGVSYKYNLVGVTEQTKVILNHNAYLVGYPVHHRIPSVGYTIIQTKQKLRPEYQGYPNHEIKRLRQENPDIIQHIQTPWLSYLGDCRFDSLMANPIALESRYLLLECTYLDEDIELEHARCWGHIHWHEIIAHADLFQKNHKIILTHFSTRYSRKYIQDVIQRETPDSLKDKIVVWLNYDSSDKETKEFTLD